MDFFSALEQRVRQIDSLLCIGLDPHPSDLPAMTPLAVRDDCLRLIDVTAEFAAAYKPNSAFFESFGPEGASILADVIAAVPDGIPVILDAKRGDIASTAEAYARAAFVALGAHAITLSPFLGRDSIAPFLVDPDRGVFLLCKTSNPGAADIQDLPLADGRMVYEAVAELARDWAASKTLGPGEIGLVVGATYPDALCRVRRLAADLWFLAPGIGAQGGDLVAALRCGLRQDGLGLLLPVSRGISRADNPRVAALALLDTLRRERDMLFSAPPQIRTMPAAGQGPKPEFRALAEGLLEAGCVRFGRFTLKSGLQSPIYIDLRLLTGYPRLLEQAAAAYVQLLRDLEYDRLAALPYAALPIGTAVSLRSGFPLIYPRKEVKDYGTQVQVEGVFITGERVVVLDDLATTGSSKFEAIDRLNSAGLRVTDVVVLIDRESGAKQALAQRGYHLHSIFTLSDLLDIWEQTGRVEPADLAAARHFIRDTAYS